MELVYSFTEQILLRRTFIIKIFKIILAGVISAAVIVSVLATPTMALGDKMSHVYEKGNVIMPDGKIFGSYSTDTAASAIAASATATCSKNASLSAKITADGLLYGKPTSSRISQSKDFGTSVSTSVNNVFVTSDGTIEHGFFLRAIGNYTIGTKEVESFVND